MEELVGSGVVARTTGTSIECVSGSAERLGPERERNGGVEQHGANAIVQCTKNTLGAAVLL